MDNENKELSNGLVLVVEDEEYFSAEVVERLRTDEGFDVVLCNKADEYFELQRSATPPTFVGAIIDIKTGGDTSGVDVVTDLAQRYRGLPIVYLSAFIRENEFVDRNVSLEQRTNLEIRYLDKSRSTGGGARTAVSMLAGLIRDRRQLDQ